MFIRWKTPTFRRIKIFYGRGVRMNRVMIAGTNSGVGKTTISMGIMAALKKRRYDVRPFKIGPDYIDPGFHKFVTGNPSYNLDSYIIKENDIKYLIGNSFSERKVGIIEGVMGLYDGFGIHSNTASSAHVSIITKTPIILVMDASGMSNSAAAVVLGYKLLDERVDIKGIIVNRVSGVEHYKLIKDIIEYHTNIKCIGYMPKNSEVALSSRHLGLIPAEEIDHLEQQILKLIDIVEECIDLDELLKIAKTSMTLEYDAKLYEGFIEENRKKFNKKRIGIAWDKAFSFYYQANLDILKKMGADLIEFSPINDSRLPTNLDSLYIGGGFPEVFAQRLSDNIEFKKSLLDYLENNGKCYAECGGYMYLSQGIKDLDGKFFDMVGFLPIKCEMTKRLQRFGYIEMTTKVNGKEYTTKAHEFHHSKVVEDQGINYKYSIKKYRDEQVKGEWQCGLHKNNTIAGYPHLYFLSNLELMIQLL